ncbi:hypothetical protein [Lysobacter claricitrinus]|uniref:hypothetical protein n=1 Tax=Lysobacter claricitrinus TaxID=3367728 RepID=UPI0037DBA3BF
MADTFDSRPSPPSDWAQAFATLPQETPPFDAWSRVVASLPGAAPRRRRSTSGWAIAATLAVASGGAWLATSALREAPMTITQQDAAGPASARAMQGDRATTVAASSAPSSAMTSTVPPTASAEHINKTSGIDAPIAVSRSAQANVVALAAHTLPTAHRQARSASDAADVTTSSTPDPRAVASTGAAPSATSSLADLRAESARLEALVAYARDDRMQSAAAAMLTGDVDDRLHVIDAALSQTGLADAERRDLWTRRVDALRELAGLEGTQRWLAAHGESYEDALARVD